MIRVALYTRVSTEDQAKEGFSLDAQLDRLHKYADAQGWTVAGEYVDGGHSGRTIKRPAYKRLMKERDDWDILLVLKMDRVHRNSRNFMAMMDQLTREDKGFASVTESLDTSTAMGRFVMDIIQRIAQLESEQIGERVLIGMEQKAKNTGDWLTRVPFGYRLRRGRLVIYKAEAEIVRWIFDASASGETDRGIATALRMSGAKSPGKGNWPHKTVGIILRNHAYLGDRDWHGTYKRDTHAAIITRKKFRSVQLKRAKRRANAQMKENVHVGDFALIRNGGPTNQGVPGV